ncbi:MAG: DUF5680 domain-containing protein [Patescibacteria group bacterium]
MTTQSLSKFLNEANKATYTNKDATKVASSRTKSQDYHFEKGDLAYHDTYFGGRDFIGEEIVYENQKPVWGANYFGFVLDKNVSEKDIYDFLRKALMQEYNNAIPVRGPGNYVEEDKTYRFAADGELANFSGKEEIIFDGKIVYRCFVHGGMIH